MKDLAITSLLQFLIASGCMLSVAHASAQETKIGFVSTERIMKESAPAKAAEARLQTEFFQRQKDLHDFGLRIKSSIEKLDKDTPVISETDRVKRQRELADMDQDYQRKQRAYSEDISQRSREEIAKVTDQATKIIKQIAESEKLDLVLQEAVYFNPRIDITEKVMKALAK